MSKQQREGGPAPLGHLSPAASQLARRAGAYASVARIGGKAMGARLREGRLAKARLIVDPEGQLAPDDRERRAEAQVKSSQCSALARAQQAKAEGRAKAQRRAARAARGPQARRQAQAAQATAQERAEKRARWAAYWGAEPDVAAEAAAEAALWMAEPSETEEDER